MVLCEDYNGKEFKCYGFEVTGRYFQSKIRFKSEYPWN